MTIPENAIKVRIPLPTLHKGLLYVSQNEPDLLTQAPPRIICYDFRGE